MKRFLVISSAYPPPVDPHGDKYGVDVRLRTDDGEHVFKYVNYYLSADLDNPHSSNYGNHILVYDGSDLVWHIDPKGDVLIGFTPKAGA